MAVSERRRVHRRAEDANVSRLARNIAVAYMLLMIGGTVGLFALERHDHERSRAAQFSSCVRVNVLRSQVNSIAHLAYLAYRDGARREARLAERTTDGTRVLHERSARQFAATAHAMRHTPLTDCREAVDDARRYRHPSPLPFRR